MKFLLIRAGTWEERGHHPIYAISSHPPLGLLYIAASLEKDGHKVEIIDFFMDELATEKMTKTIKSVDAVGISVPTQELESAITISKQIKELDPNIPILIGGPHCIYRQDKSLIDIPYSDIVVGCEGEKVIINIVEWLEGKKELANIPGIYYKQKNKIKPGKTLEIIDDLDSIAFPARYLVDQYDYGDLGLWGNPLRKKVTSMITNRGCPFNCRYCSRYGNVIKGWGYRKRSAKNVVEELQSLDKKHRTVMITDDNFLADIKRAHDVFNMILDIGLDLDFYILGTGVETADINLFKKMKKAGVKMIAYGVESGNQDVLDFYNKRINLDQVRKAVFLAKKVGFITYASFILGAPIEKINHLQNTIDFACSLPIDIAIFITLRYEMGSPLWFEAVKDKKISEDEYCVFADSNRGLGNLSLYDIKEYVRKAYGQFYFRPSYLINQTMKNLPKGNINTILYGMGLIKYLMKSYFVFNTSKENIYYKTTKKYN
jgi:magnesium-protoporphyrin IX monomethyl ester (oxidative) cyclase